MKAQGESSAVERSLHRVYLAVYGRAAAGILLEAPQKQLIVGKPA